jgi:transposase
MFDGDAMTPNELFEVALQLKGSAWYVAASSFAGQPPKLEIVMEHRSGERVECPECGTACSVYDRVEKRWRHLNFFQYECELVAKVPRANCRAHGARMIAVPWASAGSGFTLMFEAFVMLLAGQMPVSRVAELVAEEDTRLWRMIQRLVEAAHSQADWSHVRAIAIDETSARRGHRYVTVILDAESRSVLYMAQGRDSEAVNTFCEALQRHGGDPANIRWVAMDMLHCYAKGVRENFPNATIVYDRYHVMVMAGEAVDEVRKQLQRDGADLKGSLWSLRGNEWNLTPEQELKRTSLAAAYNHLGRALALRSALQDVYCAPEADGPELLKWWCRWASRSRLKPFQRLAKTIRQYWSGIASYFEHHITQGAIEAINGIIQLAKRRARGFRNFIYLRTIAYWDTGKLTLPLPSLWPT